MNRMPSRRALQRLALGFIFAAGLAGTLPDPVLAQNAQVVRTPRVAPPDDDAPANVPPSPANDGSLVFHGNYCGPGSRGSGRPPVDALDEACMHHDACSPPIGTALPSCACNARLVREAMAVAASPRQPDDIRVAANFVAEGAKVLACAR